MAVLSILSTVAEAVGEGAEHEATLLGLGPEGWVYAGVTIFFVIAIFYAKAHRQVIAALDAQIAETRKSLDEAKAIRDEAEGLLTSAKQQQAASTQQAEGIIAHAREEAGAIIAKAESDTADLVARRGKMAEEKISAAERAAVEQLRAKTARAASSGALGLIAETHTAKADKALIDQAIAAL